MGFEREWDHFQYITNLGFYLPPYAQGGSQDQSSQWIIPHSLRMKLLGRQSHTN